MMWKKDKTKLSYFVFGLLSGILISGIFLIALDSSIYKKDQNLISLPPISFDANPLIQTESDEGKIDINEASIIELTALPGIGEAKAASIVEFREKYGNFEDISELSYVPGIGNKLFESITDLITVGEE